MQGEVYTKGECKTLFKRLHDNWDDLNTVMRANPGVYQQWAWPRDPNNWKHKRADEVLEWACGFMANGDFWCGDHRELLEHVVSYLGGVVIRPRKDGDPVPVQQYILNRPIATNQTRFMGIALHEMRIALLLYQFQQDAEGREQSLALAEMIAFLYAPFFLQARIASAAPRLDRDFYVRLVQYRDLHAVDTLHY